GSAVFIPRRLKIRYRASSGVGSLSLVLALMRQSHRPGESHHQFGLAFCHRVKFVETLQSTFNPKPLRLKGCNLLSDESSAMNSPLHSGEVRRLVLLPASMGALRLC